MIPAKILPPYRDEEVEVMDLIEAHFAGKRKIETGDQTPNDEALDKVLARNDAFVRVGRVGGAPNRGFEHTDRPVIDVDVLAATRATVKAVSNEIEQLLLSQPHPIDTCYVLIGPQRVPWVEGSPVRRMYASYHLSFRR